MKNKKKINMKELSILLAIGVLMIITFLVIYINIYDKSILDNNSNHQQSVKKGVICNANEVQSFSCHLFDL